MAVCLAILLLLCSFAVVTSQADCNPACTAQQPFHCSNTETFNRNAFPLNFTFGAATSAFQVEGTARRAFNSWDYFTHRYPDKVPDRTHADLACNSFQLYMEDVKILKRLNADAYRFSVAWSRVLPKGRGEVDMKGIAYYRRLIDDLKLNGIEPFVTIFHWDVPQTLQDEYGGFLSRQIVDDYSNYAELLFETFGDKVKYWITLNQPYTLAIKGYGNGSYAPGRCTGCPSGGHSGVEPYWVAHHQLLAHAQAVSIYKNKYQASQQGNIGITLISRWFLPLNSTSDVDKEAASRAFEFFFGWFMTPLVFGHYPAIMRTLVGDRLPHFSANESSLVKGSFDFLGLNYYYTQYASEGPKPDPNNPSALTDPRVNTTFFNSSNDPIGPEAANFYYYPPGLYQVLGAIKDKYGNPLTYITENGFSDSGDVPLAIALADNGRIQCHCVHLACLKCAIQSGSNVKGYFAWSSMDNYEFGNGYSIRFGMNWVNFTHPADRREKASSKWYSRFNAK